MLEGVCGCIMACTLFLTGPRQVRKRVHCFIAELITHTVCECDAPECLYEDTADGRAATHQLYSFAIDVGFGTNGATTCATTCATTQ